LIIISGVKTIINMSHAEVEQLSDEQHESKEVDAKPSPEQVIKAWIADFNVAGGDFTEVSEYMKKNNIYEKFEELIYSDKFDWYVLFEFCFTYGIMSMLQYIYENTGISYDTAICDGYTKTFESNPGDRADMANVAETGMSNKTSLTVKIDSKYAKGQHECFTYLMNVRKKSQYYSKNKKFYYKFLRAKYGRRKQT
jgi:hypothetical protein